MTPRQAELVPAAEEPKALAIAEPKQSEILVMFERLATNPAVNPESLKALLDVRERMLDREAKASFDKAFLEMRPELPTLVERKSGGTGKYTPREDIVIAVTPILHKFGFALSHETDWAGDGKVAVVSAILTHRDGHQRRSRFMSPADNSGSKNAVQGLGSAIEYGRRYTTCDVLGIVTKGTDDDGRTAGRPEPPKGFEAWHHDLQATAETGYAALETAWKASDPKFRNYVMAHFKTEHEALKEKAKKVKP